MTHTMDPFAAAQPPRDPKEAQLAARTSQLGDVMLDRRSAQQIELADQLYQQLKAGADVKDLKDLIGRWSRTSAADLRRRGTR
ncbi:hypothetical protein AB0N07_42800 [Streptomyces sp. NPDC051172]|uniref:hypothetical protein n=1 Tax=Streptomyces sp. NPDC051172 TaxID=3155796 RepID=UPI00343E1076